MIVPEDGGIMVLDNVGNYSPNREK